MHEDPRATPPFPPYVHLRISINLLKSVHEAATHVSENVRRIPCPLGIHDADSRQEGEERAPKKNLQVHVFVSKLSNGTLVQT